MRCMRSGHLAIGALVAGISSLVLLSATAGAETVHVYTQTISGNPLAGTALNTPKGVAVDGSSGADAGSVYVADSNNNRIVKFNEAGQFQLMFGNNVNEGSGDPNVCTNAGAPTDICKTGSNNAVPGSTVGAFGPTQPIVVDSTAGASAGDIYVLGFTGSATTIQKFDPSGHLVTSYGNGSPFPGSVPVPGIRGRWPSTSRATLHLQRRRRRQEMGRNRRSPRDLVSEPSRVVLPVRPCGGWRRQLLPAQR